MSANKSRYYDVVTVTTVRANNKTDALSVAAGRKVTGAAILTSSSAAERISAQEAHEWVSAQAN